ncbi:hypothetical protein QFZ22_001009 [Streptomyces canus]|uniref:Uncharacterized protein n=1 Tax=Streptomyces canus TaxID=58343 RepID=A0AAW8F5C8_9ACTN|nr:hypothetical protein [Streptomyces canus]
MPPPASLAVQVRHALSEAGFHLVANTDSGTSGLQVSETPAGVLVRWVASDGFHALAAGQSGRAPDGGIRAVVQAAVGGVLMQRGHTVTTPEEDGILVLAPSTTPSQ